MQVAGGTQAAKQEKIEMLTKKINDLVEKVRTAFVVEDGFVQKNSLQVNLNAIINVVTHQSDS